MAAASPSGYDTFLVITDEDRNLPWIYHLRRKVLHLLSSHFLLTIASLKKIVNFRRKGRKHSLSPEALSAICSVPLKRADFFFPSFRFLSPIPWNIRAWTFLYWNLTSSVKELFTTSKLAACVCVHRKLRTHTHPLPLTTSHCVLELHLKTHYHPSHQPTSSILTTEKPRPRAKRGEDKKKKRKDVSRMLLPLRRMLPYPRRPHKTMPSCAPHRGDVLQREQDTHRDLGACVEREMFCLWWVDACFVAWGLRLTLFPSSGSFLWGAWGLWVFGVFSFFLFF